MTFTLNILVSRQLGWGYDTICAYYTLMLYAWNSLIRSILQIFICPSIEPVGAVKGVKGVTHEYQIFVAPFDV